MKIKESSPWPRRVRRSRVDPSVTTVKRAPGSMTTGRLDDVSVRHRRPLVRGVQMSAEKSLTTVSRTMASLAVGVVHTLERAVVGPARVRTARGNAWEAVCADRARAVQRAELDRLVAELGAARAELRDRQPVG
jgi:hypothetical protein